MLQVYLEKYSYVRTYINFTGSGVCEILKGGTVTRRGKQGKGRSGCETQGLCPWVWYWGRRPPWLVYCVLPLRITCTLDKSGYVRILLFLTKYSWISIKIQKGTLIYFRIQRNKSVNSNLDAYCGKNSIYE